MEKEDLFKLILVDYKTNDEKVLAVGTEDYCDSKRLEYCLDKNINTAFLEVRKLQPDEFDVIEKQPEEDTKNLIKKVALKFSERFFNWLLED